MDWRTSSTAMPRPCATTGALTMLTSVRIGRSSPASAASTAPDWIPDWQRSGEDPQPLVPCDRVYVPDTFAGVAMTSMVTFPMGTGSFEPKGTSIVAPGTTLYAGLDTVAISSEVWVDPIDRERLEFDDWKTAIHRFGFADDAAPAYEGSGVVEGSTVGQFAFGEVGDALGVVTTSGTPWSQDPEVGVDLTLLTADGEGTLMVMRMSLPDAATRKAMLETGMEHGMEASYARLEDQITSTMPAG